jgi:hypothetical protein
MTVALAAGGPATPSITILRNQEGKLIYLRPIPQGTPLGTPEGTNIPRNRFHIYDSIIQAASSYYGLDCLYLKAILVVESGLKPSAVSKANARGIAQFMQGTADAIGVQDRHDAYESIWGAAALLRRLMDRYDGNMLLMAAAYNAGPEAVDRAGRKVPPIAETQAYVPAVLWTWDRMHRYHQTLTRRARAGEP